MKTLAAVAQSDADPTALSESFRTAVLAFGSETPDNLDCVSRIDIGATKESIGPRIKSSNDPLADIAWSLEELEMPTGLREHHPMLTQEDWDAFTRLTTLLYQALTRPETL